MNSESQHLHDSITKFVRHSSSLDVGTWEYFGVGAYYSESEAEKIISTFFQDAQIYVAFSSDLVEEVTVRSAIKDLKRKLDQSDVILCHQNINKAIVFLQTGNYQIHPIVKADQIFG
jgi:hypothetical protein